MWGAFGRDGESSKKGFSQRCWLGCKEDETDPDTISSQAFLWLDFTPIGRELPSVNALFLNFSVLPIKHYVKNTSPTLATLSK